MQQQVAHPGAVPHARAAQDILIVDDDPVLVRTLARALADMGRVRFATAGTEALRLARESPPDVMLLDADMHDLTGFDVCEQMKRSGVTADVPVIFVTAHSEPAFQIGGFEAGAADFIAKPVDPRLLRMRVRAQLRVKAMSDELRRMTLTDALTGVGNRRAFDIELDQEWHRSLRAAEPVSLLLLDVDHFKAFNDVYGHPAGDVCLGLVAHAVQAACHRRTDRVYRYGGEEFAVLLPRTGREGAHRVASRILADLASLAHPHTGSPLGVVSASVGICSYGDENTASQVAASSTLRSQRRAAAPEAAQLLRACDRALYLAKGAGRARSACVAFDTDGGNATDGLVR